VRAVRGAERVVDVHVGQRGVALCQLRVVLRLAGIEAQVLEHHDLAVGHVVEVLRELHVRAEQLAQPLGDRPHRQLRVRPLRAPEMAGEDEPGAPLAQRLDRRQRGADARVVRDPPVGERHVEVDAHEHPLALDVEVVERPHTSLCRMSTQRLE
jgi:hypothetical protein